ncbi:MAG: NAD-dependent epimerase/dehydratase family protein [Nitrospirota bacterium]
MDNQRVYIVTGAAGFIGFYVAKRLLEMGNQVIGIDNINDYYDPRLKEARLALIKEDKKFIFYKEDLVNYKGLKEIFEKHQADQVCHLAAQAGVRYSLENPFAYQKSNVEGFLNAIELAKEYKVRNFVYASSSSVYGNNKKIPFSESDNVDHPISLYAATKKADELIAHTYTHLYGLPTTGLRFFTVYGPWGRPDMALFIFTKAIMEEREIDVYNYGKMKRDFTYIDDIVDGVISSLDKGYRYEIFNLGNSHTVELEYFIECIENELGKKARKRYLPIQQGDVPETFADINQSKDKLGFDPKIGIEEGIKRFASWYRSYYKHAS